MEFERPKSLFSPKLQIWFSSVALKTNTKRTLFYYFFPSLSFPLSLVCSCFPGFYLFAESALLARPARPGHTIMAEQVAGRMSQAPPFQPWSLMMEPNGTLLPVMYSPPSALLVHVLMPSLGEVTSIGVPKERNKAGRWVKCCHIPERASQWGRNRAGSLGSCSGHPFLSQ